MDDVISKPTTLEPLPCTNMEKQLTVKCLYLTGREHAASLHVVLAASVAVA